MKHYQAVLKLDENDYNARWGVADCYERKGQWVEQEKALQDILKNEQWKKDYAGVIMPALENNYRRQADYIIGTNVKKAEEFYRKSLKINKKNPETNLSLAKLLASRADRALSAKKYADAAKAYKGALKLRISKLMRRKLRGKLDIASFFAFKTTYVPRFDKVKAELVESGLFNEKELEFTVSAEAEFAAKCPRRGNPKDPAELEKILKQGRKMALSALTYKMADLVWKIAGKERPENALIQFGKHHVKIVSDGPIAMKTRPPEPANAQADGKKKRKRARNKKACFYPIKVTIPEDAVVEKVKAVDEGKFKTKEETEAAAQAGTKAEAAPEKKPDVAPAKK